MGRCNGCLRLDSDARSGEELGEAFRAVFEAVRRGEEEMGNTTSPAFQMQEADVRYVVQVCLLLLLLPLIQLLLWSAAAVATAAAAGAVAVVVVAFVVVAAVVATVIFSYVFFKNNESFRFQNFWDGQSLLSGSRDLRSLLLVRWDRSVEWSPWNCVLLTAEEAEVHAMLGGGGGQGFGEEEETEDQDLEEKLEQAYGALLVRHARTPKNRVFPTCEPKFFGQRNSLHVLKGDSDIKKVFSTFVQVEKVRHKHTLARNHFSRMTTMAKYFAKGSNNIKMSKINGKPLKNGGGLVAVEVKTLVQNVENDGG